MYKRQVYDKPVPPAEAVQVFDSFLTSLADCGVPVFVISGNHDSPERLSFGGRLMSSRKVFVAPVYDGKVSPVELKDRHGSVFVYLLPFLKPASVRRCFPAVSYTHLRRSAPRLWRRPKVWRRRPRLTRSTTKRLWPR